MYLPKEQTGFPSGYKLRTYFITYRTNILFMKENETLGSDVIGVGVRGAQIQNLTLPVVIKFKPKIPLSGNELITCVSWDQYLDKNRGGWSKEGCSYKRIENDSIICHCRFVLLIKQHLYRHQLALVKQLSSDFSKVDTLIIQVNIA